MIALSHLKWSDMPERACSTYEHFIYGGKLLTDKLLKQEYCKSCLKSTFRKYYGRYNDLVCDYSVSINEMLRCRFDSGCWNFCTNCDQECKCSSSVLTKVLPFRTCSPLIFRFWKCYVIHAGFCFFENSCNNIHFISKEDGPGVIYYGSKFIQNLQQDTGTLYWI